MISIDCTAVEDEVADNMYQRSEPDYLVYNAPLEYADLIPGGDPVKFPKPIDKGFFSECNIITKKGRNPFLFVEVL